MSTEHKLLLPETDRRQPIRPLETFTAGPSPAIEPVGPWAADVDRVLAEARRQGFAQGQAEGFAAGQAAANAELDRRRTRLAQATDGALDSLRLREEEVESRLLIEVAELALDVAAAILDREVATAVDPGAEAIARCLSLVPESGELVARLHPADADTLGEVVGLLHRELRVVADPSIQQGDAIVTVDASTIDARRASALERVRELLR